MPRHLYDSDGNYRGEVLSDKEHKERESNTGAAYLILFILILALCVVFGALALAIYFFKNLSGSIFAIIFAGVCLFLLLPYIQSEMLSEQEITKGWSTVFSIATWSNILAAALSIYSIGQSFRRS